MGATRSAKGGVTGASPVPMKSNRPGAIPLWRYRDRTGGRGSRRVRRGWFGSEQDTGESLERALEQLRRANGTGSALTLAGRVDG
jgi:hypothetical protein